MIKEGEVIIDIAPADKISRKMKVFYNPLMKFNRDMAILFLKSVDAEKIALPLAASGIRGIRILKELKRTVFFNDISKDAVKCIKRNIKLNRIKANYEVFNMEANLFLMQGGFDYIDIDPFGSPNPFLDSAVKSISRNGYLAVTATDTAPLAGTYPKACLRKYWALPLRDESMHETALRILIRKVQLIGAQYEKALIPVFSYYKDHYYRVFFQVIKQKKKCDAILKNHGFYKTAGPLWLGSLWSMETINRMISKCMDEKILRFLNIIKQEAHVENVGLYSLNLLGKELKLKQLPKMETVINTIKNKGYRASRTHINGECFKTDMPEEMLKGKVLKVL